MIDTSNWKEFRVGDLFDISSTKTTPLETLENEIGYGDYPYVTTQATENGVAGFYKVSTEKGGVLTVDSAVLGQCFYQKNDFSASDHVEKLIPKFQMTDNIALFMVTIINQEQYKYSYGRKRSQKVLRNERISLPATASGEPDWKYMEDFMGGLHSEPLKTSVKSSHIPLETEKWGEFRVGDLFDVELAKGDIKLDEMLLGDMPLVSSGETNNGVVGYIDNNGDGRSERFDSNRITVDMFGNAYYQSEPFYAVSHGRVNILSPKFDLTPNVGLFLSTIIKGDQYKYSYGRAVYSRVIENMVIRLPQTPDGEPDWKWMENYMRSLPYSDLIAA